MVKLFKALFTTIEQLELAEPHKKLANFVDCEEVNLSAQMILGVEDVPKVELKDVEEYLMVG